MPRWQEAPTEEDERPRRRERWRSAPVDRNVGIGEDVGRSYLEGLPEGIEGVLGLPGDIERAYLAGTDFLTRTTQRALGAPEARVKQNQRIAEQQRQRMPNPGGIFATGEQISENRQSVFGPAYQPQTIPGEYARTAGQFTGGAVLPGSAATRVARVVLPTAASETAGQVVRRTPLAPLEPVARLAGGLGGGLAAEAGVSAQAARAARMRPAADMARLEPRFGPLSRGERAQNPAQQLREDDYRRGVGSDQVAPIMGSFDDYRAPIMQERAMNVATRGRAAASEDAGAAGTELADALRDRIDEMAGQRQTLYDQAFNLVGARSVAATDELLPSLDNSFRAARIDPRTHDAARGVRGVVETLHDDIRMGRATHADVETARQRLNQLLGPAMRNGEDLDAFVIQTGIRELDNFSAPRLTSSDDALAGQLTPILPRSGTTVSQQQARAILARVGVTDLPGPAVTRFKNALNRSTRPPVDELVEMIGPGHRAARAMQQARQFTHEMLNFFSKRSRTELGTGHVGRRDPGGAAIERIAETDLTGEQIINQLLGGTRPSQSALGAARRIRQINDSIVYTNREAASGIRVPGRPKRGSVTRGERAFASSTEPLTPELQALREGYFHKIFEPLRTRTRGQPIPSEKIAASLRRATEGSWREVSEVLFNPQELRAMRDLSRYYEGQVPPLGRAVSGTTPAALRATAGLLRMFGMPFDFLTGGLLREGVMSAAANAGARAATVRTPPRARPLATPQRPTMLALPLSAAAMQDRGARNNSRNLRDREITIDLEGNVLQ